MERALITGASGFLGSHLLQRLTAEGVKVDVLVRRPLEDVESDSATDLDASPIGVHVVTSARDVREAVLQTRPEVCFHLATHFVSQHSPEDIDGLAESNVAFGMRVADAVAAGDCPRFVNSATAWQHVGGARYRPKNLYAATKQAFDDILVFYAEACLLDVVSLRVFDTYGVRDRRAKLLSALLDAARTGVPLSMSGGDQLVDLVHVDDVMNALSVAATVPVARGSTPARYEISSGEPISVRDLVTVLGDVVGHAIPVRWGALEPRPSEMLTPWSVGDPLPGWAPTITLREGLERLVDGS